jgi:hypothetical protein
MMLFPAGSLVFSDGTLVFPAYSFFVNFFFQFLAFFKFLSSFSVPIGESIVFVAKNNDYEQDFREFTDGCLFTSVSFTVNHDPASSLFADEFQEFKTKSSQSVDVQDNNFFDFS